MINLCCEYIILKNMLKSKKNEKNYYKINYDTDSDVLCQSAQIPIQYTFVQLHQ